MKKETKVIISVVILATMLLGMLALYINPNIAKAFTWENETKENTQVEDAPQADAAAAEGGIIKVQIRDANLGKYKSYAVLGSPDKYSYPEEARAELIGGKYYLSNAGQTIVIKDGDKEIRWEPDGKKVECSAQRIGDMSYVYIEDIEVEGKKYPLPAGTYKLEVDTPPRGYTLENAPADSVYLNVAVGSETEDYLSFYRKGMIIDLYVKGYREKSEMNTIPAGMNGLYMDRGGDLDEKFGYTTGLLKDIYSTHSPRIKEQSYEYVMVHSPSAKYAVQTSSEFPEDRGLDNAICALVAVDPVIDISTGETIAKGTVMGIYKTNFGYVQINSSGTQSFQNPNMSSDLISTIPTISPKTEESNKSTGHGNPLPIGNYAVVTVIPPDGCVPEMGLDVDVIDLSQNKWDEDKNGNISADALIMLNKTKYDTGDYVKRIVVAPDIKSDSGEDYVPSDSNSEVPLATKDWIRKHRNSKSYRIADDSNEVNDMTPVTFGFYHPSNEQYILNNKTCYLKHRRSFYYQITADEYAAKRGTARDSEEFIEIKDGVYTRRFEVGQQTGYPSLLNIITVNKSSPGLQETNDDEARITIGYSSEPISAAINNISWLNERMKTMKEAGINGQQIFIVSKDILVINPFGDYGSADLTSEIELTDINYGVLEIKNRYLVNLD